MQAQDFSNVRVLVVDDDHVFRRLMEGFISKIPCQMTFLENGRQAVDFLKDNTVDICFMDIMMPEMSGVEAAQIIREKISKTLPIIAITSANMKVTQEKCIDTGMDDFIVKPPTFDNIWGAIVKYAGQKA